MPGVSFCMFISDTVTLCLSRFPLQWRHNERGGVSNHQPHVCLRKRLLKPQIKENIKAPRHWPLCVEFTGDRWIPRTMDQWRGIRFPLMSSSCVDDRPLMCSNYLTDTHGLLCFILLCVKPVPIRAGLSERWWTQLVLKIWRLFPVRKRTLQQGIYNIKSEYKELIHFKIHIYHYLIRIFPRYNQHNSMSISCELMPWHQLWQQLIRRYQLTTVAEKYINQTTTVNL